MQSFCFVTLRVCQTCFILRYFLTKWSYCIKMSLQCQKAKAVFSKILVMKTEIKALVAEGKLEEALDKLVEYLGNQVDQFAPLYRAAQVTQSEFNQTKEKQLQGILSEEQIRLSNNQAINKVLEILEQLDRGPAPVLSPARSIWWLYAGAGALLVVVIFLVFRGFSPQSNGISPTPSPRDSIPAHEIPFFACPRFAKNTDYAIGIFQFTTLNPKDSITDQLLVEQIDAIFSRTNYKGDAALVAKINGLVDLEVAKALIEKCGVKMVIWGRVFDNSEIEINFYAPNISMAQQVELDSLLQFREQANFQASIKQAALIIASRVLVNSNAPGAVAVAEEAFEETMKENTLSAKTSPKKKNSETLATMTLANAHAKAKHYDKSIQYFDQLLDKRPKDTTAWKNRAIVQIKNNDLSGAVESIDSMRRHQKTDDPVFLEKAGEALEARGLTRKGAELKRDGVKAQQLRDQQRLNSLAPKE